MRIGIDCRLWNESGVGRYTRNLVRELSKIDKKNEYILFFRRKEFELTQLPGKNFNKNLADFRWHTVSEQLYFPSLLAKKKLDLMHFPYFSVPILYNKPFVMTIHDLILHNFPTGKASTLPFPLYYVKHTGYKLIVSRAVGMAKKIITVSYTTKKEIQNKLHIDEKNIAVTYEGVDDMVLHSSNFQKNKSPYFLYVGNAYPHKNLNNLLIAFRHLASLHPSVILILVGKEDHFYKLLKRKVNQLRLQERVYFYGEALDFDLCALYKQASALVAPSLMEGFGLPGLEAMANKCLVLASNIPVFKELYQDTPIYFNPKNIQEIADTMYEVITKGRKHYQKQIEAGAKMAKMFSWEKLARDTLRVYYEAS